MELDKNNIGMWMLCDEGASLFHSTRRRTTTTMQFSMEKKLLTKICKNQTFGGNIDAFRFENVKDNKGTQRAQYGARQLITRIHNDL